MISSRRRLALVTRVLTATFDGNARIWDVSAYQPR
jgi:hypothetical protein